MLFRSQLEQPGPVSQVRYEVEKVIEYRKAQQTSIPQYKVRCLGYLLEDDQWINAKDISAGILQYYWTKATSENTFKTHRTNNG